MYTSTPVKTSIALKMTPIKYKNDDEILASPEAVRGSTIDEFSLPSMFELSTIKYKDTEPITITPTQATLNDHAAATGAGDADSSNITTQSMISSVIQRGYILILIVLLLMNAFMFLYFNSRLIRLQNEFEQFRNAVLFKDLKELGMKQRSDLVVQHSFWEQLMYYVLNIFDDLTGNFLRIFHR